LFGRLWKLTGKLTECRMPSVTTGGPTTPKRLRRWLQFGLWTTVVSAQCCPPQSGSLSVSGQLLSFGEFFAVAEPDEKIAGQLDEKNA
jgi:hypothetical protein